MNIWKRLFGGRSEATSPEANHGDQEQLRSKVEKMFANSQLKRGDAVKELTDLEMLRFLEECDTDPTIRQTAKRRRHSLIDKKKLEEKVARRSEHYQAVQAKREARYAGRQRVLLEDIYAAVLAFAPRSSTNYHLASVEFEDGERLPEARVFGNGHDPFGDEFSAELEVPPQHIGKKIRNLSVNLRQP